MTSEPTGAGGTDEDLPDLRPVIASDHAQESMTDLLTQHEEHGEPSLHLGALTDEELVVCLGSAEAAAPLGGWYPGLGAGAQRVARACAMRSLTSREEVLVRAVDEGMGAQVSNRLLGVLRLRQERVLLSAQGMTQRGPSWYLLRRVAPGQWMRELVSEQGFHTFDLVRLDEAEEAFLEVYLQMPGDSTPSDVDLTQPAGPPSGDVVSYLSRQRNITQLAFQHPEEDLARGLVVALDDERRLTVGRQSEDGLAHRGASPEEVWQAWREWQAAW